MRICAQTGDAPRQRRAFNVRGSPRCREACRRTWLARARTKTLQDRGCGPNARRFRRAIGQVRFPGRSGIVASAAVLDMLRVEFRVIGGFDPVKPTSPRFAFVKSRPLPPILPGAEAQRDQCSQIAARSFRCTSAIIHKRRILYHENRKEQRLRPIWIVL